MYNKCNVAEEEKKPRYGKTKKNILHDDDNDRSLGNVNEMAMVL